MKRVAASVLLFASLAPGARASATPAPPGQAYAFEVAREGDAAIPNHTILRPAEMDAVPFLMPVVAWANGGCRQSNQEYNYFLTRFASYGFFIVANGAPENEYNPGELDGLLTPDPQTLIEAMDWAVAENARPDSPFYGRLDIDRIALMGQSCGGWEAMGASSDPRVKSTVIWNSAATMHPLFAGRTVLDLHAPTLWAMGGGGDFTPFAEVDYTLASVPAVFAVHGSAGHVGFWDAPSDYLDEPLVVGSRWLQLTLYDDADARAFFTGDGCGLCTRENWTTVDSKNW